MKYVCGIDIGSSKVAGCLGKFNGRELTYVCWDSVTVAGVKRGQVQDVQGLTGALSKLLKNLKAKSGVKIKSICVGIASKNIIAKHSQAVIALSERGNKSVTRTDILKVNQQAKILGSSLEEEILYAAALSYAVDNENEIINPFGLFGHQLKANLYLVCAKTPYFNTIIKIVNSLGLKLNNMTLSGLAASQALFDPAKVAGLSILCDVGRDIIQVLIFKDARLLHYRIIPSGGDDLTTSLSRELNLPYSLAEEVKVSYSRIQNNCEIQDREIIVKKGDAYSTLSQNSVIRIISGDSARIAGLIRDTIRPYLLAVYSPLWPDKTTLYVSGRTACLDGFLELIESTMEMPVKMAKVGNPNLLTPLTRNRLPSGQSILKYLACFGLIAGAIKPSYTGVPAHNFHSSLSYISERIKEIYQEYF